MLDLGAQQQTQIAQMTQMDAEKSKERTSPLSDDRRSLPSVRNLSNLSHLRPLLNLR
jgi:hypothetical protein